MREKSGASWENTLYTSKINLTPLSTNELHEHFTQLPRVFINCIVPGFPHINKINNYLGIMLRDNYLNIQLDRQLYFDLVVNLLSE